jgi:GR25 family glycosyltransferase involved in LPS biosynthesis
MTDILHIIHADIRNTPREEKATDTRMQNILTQCNEQSIKFVMSKGVTTERQTFHNINLAHKNLIRMAKENGFKRIIIAEDDIVFTAPGAWKYFLSQIPENYDLFLGLVYAGEVAEGRVLNGFSGGMTLYSIHERFYDFALSIPTDTHVDRKLGEAAFEKEYYVCQPYVCRQAGGYSHNLHRNAEYTEYERDKKFYGLD